MRIRYRELGMEAVVRAATARAARWADLEQQLADAKARVDTALTVLSNLQKTCRSRLEFFEVRSGADADFKTFIEGVESQISSVLERQQVSEVKP